MCYKSCMPVFSSRTYTSMSGISYIITKLPNIIISSTKKYFTEIVSFSYHISSSSSSFRPSPAPSPNLTQFNFVIEYLESNHRNVPYIKSIFNFLEIDINLITNISFKSHYSNLHISSPFALHYVINSWKIILDSNFKSLFLPQHLDKSIIKNGRLARKLSCP